MSNITIITGPPNSGKTELVRALTLYQRKHWFEGRTKLGSFDLEALNEKTNLIVIDDLSMGSGFWKLFTMKKWEINRRGKLPILITPPDIIITTTLDIKSGDCNFSQIYNLSVFKIAECSLPDLPF